MRNELSSQQLVAKQYLEEIGFKNISADVKNMLTMSGELIVNNNKHEILVYIDCNFPLVYPKFYFKDNLFLQYPHIERKNELGCGICLEEESQKRYHPNCSELLCKHILRLEEFILKMDNGELEINDFMDEFESYWAYSGLAISINTEIFTTNGIFNGIYLRNTNHVIVDLEQNITQYAKACNIQNQKLQILYLDFGTHFIGNIPKTYVEFFNIIENAGHKKIIESMIFNKNISSLLIFSFVNSSQEKIFAALQLEYPTQKKSKFSSYHIFMNKVQSLNSLKGYSVQSINKQRLFMRGGDNKTKEITERNKHIAIIGCGSIGGTLAYKLAKSGVSKFTLIDSEMLESNNIGRHLLGIEHVGLNKAKAVQNYLEKQFLHCNIKAIQKRAEKCVDELADVDIIIIALGSDAPHIEEYLIEQSMQGKVPPVITCWFEANAISGHAILFDNQTDLKQYSVLQLFEKIQILDTAFAASLLKRDAGCNSTYMPYSFINADLHINHFSHMILKYLLGYNDHSVLSSVGELSREYILKNKTIQDNHVIKMAIEEICVN